MVGATNRSMAAMSSAWFCRKVRHPWLGGRCCLTMYLATLDCATSNPSLSSSPWIRGAPQRPFHTSKKPGQVTVSIQSKDRAGSGELSNAPPRREGEGEAGRGPGGKRYPHH